MVTAISAAVGTLASRPASRVILASSLALAATLGSMAAFAVCSVHLPPADAALATSAALLVAHALAQLATGPETSSPLPPKSFGPQARFIATCAACAAATTLPLLGALGAVRPADPFFVLASSSVALTALLMAGASPLLLAQTRARHAPDNHPDASRLRLLIPPSVALLALLALLLGRGDSFQLPPLGSFGPWAWVCCASLAVLVALLADVPLAVALWGPSAIASLATWTLSSGEATARPAMAAATAVLTGGTTIGVLLAHVLPGARPPRAASVVSRAAQIASSSALGLLGAAPMFPRDSRVSTAGAAFGFAVVAGLVPVFDGLLFGRMLRPAVAQSLQPVDVHTPAHLSRFARRFRHLPPWIRFAALAKLELDPLFPAIGDVLPRQGTALDLGCGYGLVAAWLSTARPDWSLTCVEVSPSRAALARHVAGPHARVVVADLQDLEQDCPPAWAQKPVDAVLLIDVVHHLDNIDALFAGVARLLSPAGLCLVRTAVMGDEPGGKEGRMQRWERAVVGLRGQRVVRYRTAHDIVAALRRAGFSTVERQTTANRSEQLFVARR